MDYWGQIKEIQKEYFDLLENDVLIKQCSFINEKEISIPSKLLNPSLIVFSKGHWIASSLPLVENLFNSVFNFWQINEVRLTHAVQNLPGHAIHVNDSDVKISLSKYGPFFHFILVSDQLMVSRQEYIEKKEKVDWRRVLCLAVEVSMKILKYKDLFVPQEGRPLAVIVPASTSLDRATAKIISEIGIDLAFDFICELFDREIKDIDQLRFFLKSEKSIDNICNPFLKDCLLSYYKAKNFHEFQKVVTNEIYHFHGVDWGNRDPFEMVLLYTLAGRLFEFERYSADAFKWNQEPELSREDSKLYSWWFEKTAKTSAKALGTSYSEDFMVKIMAQAPQLKFLETVSYDAMKGFLQSDPVEQLREDISINRNRLMRSNGDLQSDINILGEFLSSRFVEFEHDIAKKKKSLGLSHVNSAVGLTGSAAMTVASIYFPPIGYLSLLWGGSITDWVKNSKKEKKELNISNARPIATLLQWKNDLSPSDAKMHGR